MTLTIPPALRSWFDGLAPRERRLLIVGGIAIVLMVVYFAVVTPVRSAHSRLMNDVQQKQQLLALINRSAGRIQSAGASGGHLKPGESVFAATSAAIQSSPISGAVQRLEQTRNGGVRLSLSGVDFDALVQWLGTLSRQDGIVAIRATIQQSSNPGTVDAKLTLNTSS
ncbi:MAG TPA: type II secretion system protein M [Gammaproteobacteria bacterium]|nr:type II secretion system protein M [Gammaproteobacteria bacterium]